MEHNVSNIDEFFGGYGVLIYVGRNPYKTEDTIAILVH